MGMTQLDRLGGVLAEVDVTFACTAAIANTTAVTMMVAPGASKKNYLKSLQLKNTNAVATEVQVKQGSTVIWRGHVSASMLNFDNIEFNPPLRGAANAAISITAVTTGAAIYVNAQGYVGI